MSELILKVYQLEAAERFLASITSDDNVTQKLAYKVSINSGMGIDHIFEFKLLHGDIITALDKEIRETKQAISDIIYKPNNRDHG